MEYLREIARSNPTALTSNDLYKQVLAASENDNTAKDLLEELDRLKQNAQAKGWQFF